MAMGLQLFHKLSLLNTCRPGLRTDVVLVFQVSWMRIRDYNVLTMNEVTNTKDPRIRAIHVPGSDTWSMRIEETTAEDTGEYECQVTTPNKTILIVNLTVLGEIAKKIFFT